MKEQDAAHSFEARLEFLREYAKCGINHNYSHSDSLKHKLQTLDSTISELTRLRSELQQEREKQFNLPDAAVFNLQQIALADDDMVKVPGAAEQYRFIARHILELFQKSKAK